MSSRLVAPVTSSLRQISRRFGRQQSCDVYGSTVQRPVRMRYSTVVNSPHPDIDASVLDAPITSLSHFELDQFPKYAKLTALVDGLSGREVSYGELQTMVTKVASSLVRQGLVQKGTVVTLFSTNCIEFVIMYLAVTATGAIISPVNPTYTVNELVSLLNLAESSVLVSTEALLPVSRQARQLCPTVKELIVFGDGHTDCRPFSSLLLDDMSAFPEHVQLNPRQDIAALPFSSGTTGLPKAVMLTHHNIYINIHQLRSRYALNFRPEFESLTAVLPLFHMFGMILLLNTLSIGGKNIILPQFDPQSYLNAIQKYRATFLGVVPPMMQFLALHPLVAQTDFSSVDTILNAAAPIASVTIDNVYRRLNKSTLEIKQGFGLTESGPATHTHVPGKPKKGTVGVAIQNTQFKIVDVVSGESLGVGQNGELCVRGPQVMKGYLKNDKATAEAIDAEGWLHTGDLGHFDDEEHLVIEDRIKELIKVKALQVAPAELEALLLSHESVQDVAVVGRYVDERVGELPTAFVVLKSTAQHTTLSTQETLQQFVNDRVAEHKRLTGGVIFCNEIPKAASGKILRRILRDELNKGQHQESSGGK